ncbi:MAG: outer membrane protein assembly factor BamD, partial [Phycisphaeraceae bacterium]
MTKAIGELRRGWRLAACLAMAWACWPGAAIAQPTHELNDDGVFERLAEPDPATPKGQLQLIRRVLVSGDADEAEDRAEDWIEANPGSDLMAEALLLKADAIAAQGDYYRSLTDYELVIGLYPGTEQYRVAIEREYDIAKLFTGGLLRKGRWVGIRLFDADDTGIELLIRVQERLPGSALGERASIDIGDYYFDEGDMEMASEAYDLFLLNYPESRQREWAMLRLIQASLAKYKGPEFDPSGLTDAAQRLREYQRDYPAAAEKIGAEALMVRIDESLAKKKLVTARWYEKRGQRRGAITMYRNVIRDYPGSSAAVEALIRNVGGVGAERFYLDPEAYFRGKQMLYSESLLEGN